MIYDLFILLILALSILWTSVMKNRKEKYGIWSKGLYLYGIINVSTLKL